MADPDVVTDVDRLVAERDRLSHCLEAEGRRLDELGALHLAESVRAAKAEAGRDALKALLAEARDEAFEEAAAACRIYGKRMEDEFCVNHADGDGFAEAVRALKSDPTSKEMTFEDLKAAVVFQRQRAEDAESRAVEAQNRATEAGLQRDHWETETQRIYGELNRTCGERDSLRAQLTKAEADVKTLEAKVGRMTWEANGAKMRGET